MKNPLRQGVVPGIGLVSMDMQSFADLVWMN
jgi:hypothetical protein